MDFLRSAYDVPMIFRTGDPPIMVRWRRADPGALAFPGPHVFESKNWQERFCVAGDLGEQPGARPWSNGKAAGDTQGTIEGCQPIRWFQTGLQPGETGATFGPDCKVACCRVTPMSYWNGNTVPDRIKVSLSMSPGATCDVDGMTFTIKRVPGKSSWHGEGVLFGVCYQYYEITLDRTGPTAVDWIIYVNLRTLGHLLPPNAVSTPVYTFSPFAMTFSTSFFSTLWFTGPVDIILTPL